jgi:hypothetical protein
MVRSARPERSLVVSGHEGCSKGCGRGGVDPVRRVAVHGLGQAPGDSGNVGRGSSGDVDFGHGQALDVQFART